MTRETHARHHPGLRQRRLQRRPLMHQAGYKVIGIGEWDGGLYNPNGIDIARAVGVPPEATAPSTASRARRSQRPKSSAGHRLRHPGSGRDRERHHLQQRRPGEGQDPGAKAPTVPPPPLPTTSWPKRASSSFPTFWPTPAASPPPTSSGCRTARATSGRNRWSTSSWSTSWCRSFEDVVRYAETHHVNNRIAAYMLAIDRVAYTIRQRGIYA